MAEGGEDTLQEPVDESQQPFDPPLDQINLPDLKEAFYLDADHIREVQDKNGEVETLGKGSFGRVTKVYWNELPCAAKESADDFKLLSDENRRRATKGFFVESLQLAARLRHPNIVQYIGLWRKPNGKDIIIMELLPRNSLTRFLTDSRTRITSIPLHVKRRVLADVCCAMIYLHNLRPCVLHRDLTSNNILLTNDFRAKVTDFGQARFYADADQDKLTKQPGTRDFMPPEALLPEPKYGKPLDRFSFGCVTLHMLTHNWPKPNVVASKKPRTPWDNRKHLLPHLSSEQRDRFIKPIVIPCLDIKPEKRPTFKDIYRILTTSGDVFTDDECKRMLDRDIDPASMQNKLPEGGTSSKNISEMDEQLKRESSEWQSEITALKLEVATGKEHAKIQVAQLEETQSSMAATTSQLEQAAAARNEMEKELQHLREKCDHLEQEHQETLAKKVEELNSMKRESEREIQALKETHATLIAAKEKSLTKKSQDVVRLQDKLAEAQRKELDLNDQLRLYRNQLEATKVALQVEKDKLHSKEESVCQKEEEVKKLKGDLQSERDKVQTLEEAALQKERELDQCKDSKAAMEKDLVRARKMAKDLLDERVVVNVESEQQMENLNERLVEFKQQAVLSEERLKQVQGLEGEHLDLKVQLKALTTTLEDFQKVLTDEQKSRKSLDASVKALTAEIDQLRTELKERDNEVSSLTAANKHLQRKMDAADVNSGEMKAEITQLRTELKERGNKVSSLAAANWGLQRKVDAADADITEMKEKAARLQGELAESQRASETQRNELVVTHVQRQLAEKKRDKLAEKYHEADQLICRLKQEAEVTSEDLQNIKEKNAELRGQLGVVVENQHELEALRLKCSSAVAEKARVEEKLLAASNQVIKLEEEAGEAKRQLHEAEGRCSDLEADKAAKLQASQWFADKLEAEKDDYQEKLSNANELIMQHLSSQTKGGSPEHLPSKTEFQAMMEFFKVFYDKSSKQSEQTAEENQRLLAKINELKEKVQKMAQASLALQEKLSEKQKFLDEQQGEMLALREQLSLIQEMEIAPVPLASDVIEETGDEVVLQRLCYMATGIKELLVGPDGGTFCLGSGDASLEVPPGAVEKETSVRYAIILHGPFLFPTGYKTSSVVVYINMDGAVLKKAIVLFLSHWCNIDNEDMEDPVKFFTAPHSVEVGQNYYEFKEQDGAEFNTTSAILSIMEPQCLHCVKMKKKKQAVYNALCFKKYEDVGTLFFKIQLMCDSSSWNEKMREELNRIGWKEEKTNHSTFSFAQKKVKEIHTEPEDASGPGWEAAVDGQHSIGEKEFLEPTTEMDKAVQMERFPPSISYKVVYTYPHLRSANPKYTTLKINMVGTSKKVSFGCRIEEGETDPTSPVSPAFFSSATSPRTPGRMAASYGPTPATSGHIPSAERHPSSRQVEISQPAATAVPDAVTDGPSATTPPTETAADILDHFRDQFINDAASSDIMYELKHKDVISSGDVEMIERKPDVTQQNQYLHECLMRKCTKEALMEVCNVMTAVRGNPKINALGKDMRRRLTASYGPSPATSGPIPSAERHPSSPQAETSKTADPTSPVSPAFFSSATSPRTPGRMAASYGPSPATSGHIPSAERHPSSPQAEISQPAEVIEALNHDLDAQWREFGTHLCVKPSSMDIIDKNNKSDAGACMLQLVEKWLVQENGTGDLPRTWVTVVQAVKKTGKGRLAEELAQRYGVQLPGQ